MAGVPGESFTIDECDIAETPDIWDRLVPPTSVGFYSCRTWNLAMIGQNGTRERAVVVRGGDGAVRAIVPVFRYDGGPANAHLHPGTLFGGAVRVTDPVARDWEPVTVLGSASGYATTPAVAGDVAGWATAVANETEKSSGAVVVPHLLAADVARLRPLMPDVPVLLTSARITVPVPPVAEEEYEASLRKRERDRVRWERRLLVRGDRTITIEPITAANEDEIGELQENTQRRHDSYGDAAQFVRRYRQIRAVFGDRLFAFVCRHDGRAIGSLSCLEYGSVLIGRSAGLDYDRIGRHAEYFNLAVHEPVRYCLRRGLREFDLGVGGYPQKILRGGVPAPVWSLLVRPPAHWSPRDSVRHNRERAAGLRAEFGPSCPSDVDQLLGRLAASGTAE
jgi:hypothetical protein